MGENPLHQFANYTYNLELWACSKGTFNGDSGSGDELMIVSGGAGEIGMFGLDNVEIETIIGGMGKNGFAADALTIKMDIIEPYTVTLLEKLAELGGKYGEKGDIKTLIYMLKIKFIGYNDGGYGGPHAIDVGDKHFYFNIITLGFNITHKGAVYRVEGVATKSLPMMTMLDNIVPANIELQGKTVNELFGSGEDGNDDPEVKNLTKALEKLEKLKIDNKVQTIKNKISFKFDEEFGEAKIIDPESIQRPNSTIPGSNIKKSLAQETLKQGRTGKLEINVKQGTVKALAGTRMVDFIGAVLSSTDYMKKQVEDEGGDKPFIGWKVWPEVKLLDYDKATNYYAREVTFKVEKYEYKGLDHPNFGQAAPDNIVKTYNYIYTGENKDVVKVNLDFHMAFFEVRSIKSNLTNSETKEEKPEEQKPKIPDESKDVKTDLIKPFITVATGDGRRDNTVGTTNDPKAIAVGEMMSKLLDNGIDMMALDIEIVGDPDWILQDKEDGIEYKNKDVNFKFRFIAPTQDYDQSSGLFQLGPEAAYFGGIYKVITVKSTFRKGKFTQTLTNVRCRKQPGS